MPILLPKKYVQHYAQYDLLDCLKFNENVLPCNWKAIIYPSLQVNCQWYITLLTVHNLKTVF